MDAAAVAVKFERRSVFENRRAMFARHARLRDYTAFDSENSGIGLPNLKQQLELIYPGKHRLTLTETESLFTVKLIIDLP